MILKTYKKHHKQIVLKSAIFEHNLPVMLKICGSALFAFSFMFISPVKAQLNADFIADRTNGCQPLTVKFSDKSTGGATSWSWTLGNGNTSTDKNPSAIYTTPGTYTVKLTVSNGVTSDIEEKIAFITVFKNPTAGFSISAQNVCIGSPLTFIDTSIIGDAPIVNRGWIFGDGASTDTTAGTISHAYGYGGAIPVSLIVTDSNGCTSNNTALAFVQNKALASFTADKIFSCTSPLTVTFSNTSTTVSTTPVFSWNFGDGNTSSLASPQHTYTKSGNYTVTLIVQDQNCNDTVFMNNFIRIGTAKAAFTSDKTSICLGDSISFSDTSGATSRTWHLGDGSLSSLSNFSHLYNSSGTYNVSLSITDQNGCKDSLMMGAFITVFPRPSVGFVADTTSSCSFPFTVTFSDTSKNANSWLWDFGDNSIDSIQNPIHTYTSSGTFNVSLKTTSANGCVDSTGISPYIIISPPIADFQADTTSGCIPLPVNFTATGSSMDSIVKYIWHFGDGTIDTTQFPLSNHTYVTEGVFDVKLEVITSTGCTDTLLDTSYIQAGSSPLAGFLISDTLVCFGTPITFTDTSSQATQWYWDFGDGGHSTQKSPVYVYGDTGTFDVKLVSYNKGCPDSIIITDLVTILPPKPAFTFIHNCATPYIIQFNDASAGADSVTWDFGDNTYDNSNNRNPIHTYALRGSYTVVLTAFKDSCSFTATNSIPITDPVANFEADTLVGCYPFPVNFADSSIDASSWEWTFGDNNTATSSNPSNTYALPGLYDVELIVKDGYGCADTMNKLAYIRVLGAIPDFATDKVTGCAPLLINFFDSTQSDSAIIRWEWSYGDGESDTMFSPNVSHTYLLPGLYTVSQTVTDKNGCSHTKVVPDLIWPTFPYPSFTVDTFACKGDSLVFDASATNAIAPTFTWVFGDGDTVVSTSPTTIHAFPHDSIFPVQLIVTDTNGCDSTYIKNVYIIKPKANFIDTTLIVGCGIKKVLFRDLSTGYVNAWQWDFGNGASSQSQHPTYTYTIPGTYTVRLIVTNLGGCIDTIIMDSLVIVPGPIGVFTFTPTKGCKPLPVNFFASSGNAENYSWDFGDGTVMVNANDTMQHTYIQDIYATPILLLGTTLPDGKPCQLPARNLTGTISVISLLTANIPTSTIQLNEGGSIPITSIVGNAYGQPSYSWSPDVALNCNDCPSVFVSGLQKDTTYYLIVTDTAGCTATDSVRVLYIPCDKNWKVPNIFTPNNDGVNDYFKLDVCPADEYKLLIYNRWGELIYRSNLQQDYWDGHTLSGSEAPEGTYFYLLNMDGVEFNGFVQLIRG